MSEFMFCHTDMTRDVLEAIARERLAQDRQWGGPEHDDRHSGDDWALFIDKQILAVRHAYRNGNWDEYREHMVKVAALAVAAVEVLNRMHPHNAIVESAPNQGAYSRED